MIVRILNADQPSAFIRGRTTQPIDAAHPSLYQRGSNVEIFTQNTNGAIDRITLTDGAQSDFKAGHIELHGHPLVVEKDVPHAGARHHLREFLPTWNALRSAKKTPSFDERPRGDVKGAAGLRAQF